MRRVDEGDVEPPGRMWEAVSAGAPLREDDPADDSEDDEEEEEEEEEAPPAGRIGLVSKCAHTYYARKSVRGILTRAY